MQINQEKKTKAAENNAGEKVNQFIQKNRKIIFISFGIIVLLIIGFITYSVISESMNKKAIAELEELIEEYERVLFFVENDYYSSDVYYLLVSLEEFAKKTSGFPASKAWSLIADIHSIRKDWPLAEEYWLHSAKTGAKTYLGPIAYFQAAVCAEEQNKPEQAITYLQQSVSHDFEFPDAPRAQFNIGRLYEQLGDYSRALEAYRAVMLNYQWTEASQDMLIWQNFARNQIIKLEVR